MKFKSLNDEAKKDWHDWFAWYPVRINDYEKVWLCKIKRKGFRWFNCGRETWEWQYELV